MMEGPCADSEEKREPAGDIDTVVVDGLKVLDPKRPIREADVCARLYVVKVSGGCFFCGPCGDRNGSSIALRYNLRDGGNLPQ
jgi:hypothetical protein